MHKAANQVKIALYKGLSKVMDVAVWNYITGPLPRLTFEAPLFFKLRQDPGRKYELQVFDPQERLVFRKRQITLQNGQGIIEQIRNVYVGGKYRAVILTDYYLPRQTYIRIHKDFNEITFKPMILGDFNKDGTLNAADFITLLRNPRLLLLFIP